MVEVSEDTLKLVFPKAMEKYLGCNRMISLEISNDPVLRDVKITKNVLQRD